MDHPQFFPDAILSQFMSDIDKEIKDMKLQQTARARVVAKEFLKDFQ